MYFNDTAKSTINVTHQVTIAEPLLEYMRWEYKRADGKAQIQKLSKCPTGLKKLLGRHYFSIMDALEMPREPDIEDAERSQASVSASQARSGSKSPPLKRQKRDFEDVNTEV